MNEYGFKVCRIKCIKTLNCHQVTIKEEQFLSFTAPEAFIYELGKPTNRRSGYGPLALWPTLELARKSVHPARDKGFRCFECTYIPSADTKLWVPKTSSNRIDPSQTPPKGTVLAESIMLLKAVPWVLPSVIPSAKS